MQFGITNSNLTQIIANPSICVKLKFKVDPLKQGTYAKYKQEKLIKTYLDGKIGSIVNDDLSTVGRPKFPEVEAKTRYEKGF